jgi:hypothetical protein
MGLESKPDQEFRKNFSAGVAIKKTLYVNILFFGLNKDN